MSHIFLNAVWQLRLPPMQKLLLLALADQADPAGVVRLTRRRLARMTNQSRATITRQLFALKEAKLLKVDEAGTATTVQRYKLLVTGAHTEPGLTVSSAQGEFLGGSHRAASDPSYSPKAKIKAEAPKPRRLETPTPDQVTKLCHLIFDDHELQLHDEGDVEEYLKRACSRAGFLYDADIIRTGINRAVSARGWKPWLPLNSQVRR